MTDTGGLAAQSTAASWSTAASVASWLKAGSALQCSGSQMLVGRPDSILVPPHTAPADLSSDVFPPYIFSSEL